MFLSGEIGGDDKQFADGLRDRLKPVNAVELVFGHLLLGFLFDGLNVDIVFLQDTEEVVVKLDQHLIALDVVGDVLVVGDVVDRLTAAGRVADHRRGARRRDRRRVVVTHREAVGPLVGILAGVVFEPLTVVGRVGVLRVRVVVERATLGGELVGGPLRLVVDVGHQLLGDSVGLVGAIPDTDLDVKLGQPHDAKADLPHVTDGLFDLVDREIRHGDDVFEEPGAGLDPAVERIHVDGLLDERLGGRFKRVELVAVVVVPDPPVGGVLVGERREVDVTEVASLVLFERLLAAGVGGENLVIRVFLDVEGVLFVDTFEIDDTGFAVFVGTVDHVLPELLGGNRKLLTDLNVLAEAVQLVQFLRLVGGDMWFLGARVGEGELLAVEQCLHELVGDTDGDIEVRQVALDGVAEVFGNLAVLVDQLAGLFKCVGKGVVREVVGIVQSQRVCQRDILVLGVDELDHVGMGDTHDAHLRAAACATLCDGLAHLVVGAHEGDRAGGDAAGRADRITVRAEIPEGIAHAAAALEDLGGLLGGLVDIGDIVTG